jgi:hypothetical protein
MSGIEASGIEAPLCTACGLPVVTVQREKIEDELRTTSARVFYRPGATWATCVDGHRVRTAPDPGPRPLT